VPRTGLTACALTNLLVEDMVQRAGQSGQHVANTLAGVSV